MRSKPIFSLIFLISIFNFLLSCKESSNTDGYSESGIGGSTARFVIVRDYLYTIETNHINIFNINNPNDITYCKTLNCTNTLETVFLKDTTLFIGTRQGMYIFNVSNPENPSHLSTYEHIYSCDPVVADSNFAYVTLHSEDSRCNRTTNRLDIIDIKDLKNLVFVKSYQMTSPRGLGIDSNLIFICDQGLKIYDIANVIDLKYLAGFNIKANDVIPLDSILIVTADDGLYQYKYTDNKITLLSKIVINQ